MTLGFKLKITENFCFYYFYNIPCLQNTLRIQNPNEYTYRVRVQTIYKIFQFNDHRKGGFTLA